jgi:hypothetical protein
MAGPQARLDEELQGNRILLLRDSHAGHRLLVVLGGGDSRRNATAWSAGGGFAGVSNRDTIREARAGGTLEFRNDLGP